MVFRWRGYKSRVRGFVSNLLCLRRRSRYRQGNLTVAAILSGSTMPGMKYAIDRFAAWLWLSLFVASVAVAIHKWHHVIVPADIWDAITYLLLSLLQFEIIRLKKRLAQ